MGVWQNLKMRFWGSRNGYDAGGGREGDNWTPVDGRAEDINAMSRDMIRRRARDLERNADYAESSILAMERNVVGSGIRLDCKVDNPELERQTRKTAMSQADCASARSSKWRCAGCWSMEVC